MEPWRPGKRPLTRPMPAAAAAAAAARAYIYRGARRAAARVVLLL